MNHLDNLSACYDFDEDIVRLYLHGKISPVGYQILMTEISPNKEHWKKVFAFMPQYSARRLDPKVVTSILFAFVVSLILISRV